MGWLYQKYRPKTFDEMVGQETAIKQLKSMVSQGKISHAVLMSGPSGCGKTTAARILATLQGAGNTGITEVNCALSNGVDTIRDIESKAHLKPLGGQARVYILDEFHAVSGAAQRGLLKLLEDPPGHLYFILCTTNPEKLEKPVVTRCVNIKFDNLPVSVLKRLVEKVIAQEKVQPKDLPDPSLIAEAAEGSARKALVILEQLMSTDRTSDWFAILETVSQDSDFFPMVRELYSGSLSLMKWGPKLKDLPESEVEGLRMCILSYGSSILCSGRTSDTRTVVQVMEAFKNPFFSSKKPGFILELAKVALYNYYCPENTDQRR